MAVQQQEGGLAHEGTREEMTDPVWMAPRRRQEGILHFGLTGMNRSFGQRRNKRTFKDRWFYKDIEM